MSSYKITRKRGIEEKIQGKDVILFEGGWETQLPIVDCGWLNMTVNSVVGSAAPGFNWKEYNVKEVFETTDSCEPQYRDGEHER
jgi:hypothetical protein